MKEVTNFKSEFWCMDVAYVDKLAEDNNGVKCLLVRQDLFDGTVDAKGMKIFDSEETVRASLTMILKKKRLECQESRLYLHYVQQATTRKYKT